MKNRLLSLMLALILAFGFLTVAASASCSGNAAANKARNGVVRVLATYEVALYNR